MDRQVLIRGTHHHNSGSYLLFREEHDVNGFSAGHPALEPGDVVESGRSSGECPIGCLRGGILPQPGTRWAQAQPFPAGVAVDPIGMVDSSVSKEELSERTPSETKHDYI